MTSEIFYEEGLVVRSLAGEAHILINTNPSCPACAAKMICRTGGDDDRSLIATDPLGVQPGDQVRIEVYGSGLLKAALLLYGMLLALLLTGLTIGLLFFDDLTAGILALCLPGLYALGMLANPRLLAVQPRFSARIVAMTNDNRELQVG